MHGFAANRLWQRYLAIASNYKPGETFPTHVIDWLVDGRSLVKRPLILPPATDGGHRIRVRHQYGVTPQHLDATYSAVRVRPVQHLPESSRQPTAQELSDK